jgi:hypothetical protein
VEVEEDLRIWRFGDLKMGSHASVLEPDPAPEYLSKKLGS